MEARGLRAHTRVPLGRHALTSPVPSPQPVTHMAESLSTLDSRWFLHDGLKTLALVVLILAIRLALVRWASQQRGLTVEERRRWVGHIRNGMLLMFGIGTRDDRLVKEDGVWVFKHLLVNAWRSLEDVPWQGDLKMKGRPAMTPPKHKLEDN